MARCGRCSNGPWPISPHFDGLYSFFWWRLQSFQQAGVESSTQRLGHVELSATEGIEQYWEGPQVREQACTPLLDGQGPGLGAPYEMSATQRHCTELALGH